VLQSVLVPTSVDEAVGRLVATPDAALLAGGTLLVPVINNGASAIRVLVSTRRLELDRISVDADRAVIGAGATLADAGHDERLGFLRLVIESIASPPIRNLATVGGNLFARQPYGDLAVAFLALDAVTHINGSGGTREAPIADVLDRGVEPGEIVTAIGFALPPTGAWFYRKAMRRRLNAAAIVTVAAVIAVNDGAVSEARIALGGAGPRPVRARSAEDALRGTALDLASVSAAAARAVEDAQPFSDAYASAWYRARVLPVHIRRAILGE
jgi:CO/xanthine dehydrogenase FAD-binding subunit